MDYIHIYLFNLQQLAVCRLSLLLPVTNRMSYNDDYSMKVFVGSIDFKASEQEITEAFQQYGEIVNTVILRDKETQKSRGFGFITFKDKNSVEEAIRGMNNKLIRGRPIVVNYAEKKSASAGNKPQNSYGGGQGGQNQYYGQQQQQQQQNYYQGQAGYGGWGQQGYGWQQQGQPYWPQQYGSWNQQQAQNWGQQQGGNQAAGNGYQQSQQYSGNNSMSYNGSGGY